MNDKKYVLVRTYSAGVFLGWIEEENDHDQVVVLRDARRIWYWEGAASLSELVVRGPGAASACKFPDPVDRVKLFQVTEILDCTPEAVKAIQAVPVWSYITSEEYLKMQREQAQETARL